ncbi:MAG: winged helix-turn-helix transcriptional regulator [Solirubrobacterales bacterium]|jgi:sugar-specific transcriptional regulator TrmB
MPPQPRDVLDQARSLIERRLKELDAERVKLERTLADLTDGKVGRRRPGRPRGSRTRRRRGRRGGTRADQAVKIISENPGITASEVAKRLRIKPNYVYRVMGELRKEGRVRKRGRGYVAA